MEYMWAPPGKYDRTNQARRRCGLSLPIAINLLSLLFSLSCISTADYDQKFKTNAEMSKISRTGPDLHNHASGFTYKNRRLTDTNVREMTVLFKMWQTSRKKCPRTYGYFVPQRVTASKSSAVLIGRKKSR